MGTRSKVQENRWKTKAVARSEEMILKVKELLVEELIKEGLLLAC